MKIAILNDWRRLLAGATLLVIIAGLAWVVGTPRAKQAIPAGVANGCLLPQRGTGGLNASREPDTCAISSSRQRSMLQHVVLPWIRSAPFLQPQLSESRQPPVEWSACAWHSLYLRIDSSASCLP